MPEEYGLLKNKSMESHLLCAVVSSLCFLLEVWECKALLPSADISIFLLHATQRASFLFPVLPAPLSYSVLPAYALKRSSNSHSS